MRREGATVPELINIFILPKTTIWYHIKDVVLATDIQLKINSQKGGSALRRIKKETRAKEMADSLLVSNSRELIIAVAMLYWAEGHKKDFIFTNTDPEMLKLYLLFLEKVCAIKRYDITVLVRIPDRIDPMKTRDYWMDTLGLQSSNIKLNQSSTHNKTKTKHGICRIMVKKSSFYLKLIHAIIQKLQEQIISSGSSMDRTLHS